MGSLINNEYLDPNEGADLDEVDSLLGQTHISPHATLSGPFRAVHTVWLLVLQELVIVGFVASLFLVPADSWYIIPIEAQLWFGVLLQVSVYLFVVISERFVHYQHGIARTAGYLEFHSSTASLVKMPSLTFSMGNAAVLLLLSLWDPSIPYEGLERIHVLYAIAAIEALVCCPALIYLLWKTIKFNSSKAYPDAMSELLPGFERASTTVFQSPGGFGSLEQVVERQGDLIAYHQQHARALNSQITEMRDRIRVLEHQHGVEPDADMQDMVQQLRSGIVQRDRTIRELEDALAQSR